MISSTQGNNKQKAKRVAVQKLAQVRSPRAK